MNAMIIPISGTIFMFSFRFQTIVNTFPIIAITIAPPIIRFEVVLEIVWSVVRTKIVGIIISKNARPYKIAVIRIGLIFITSPAYYHINFTKVDDCLEVLI
ncbi:hypothetical protein ACLIA0_07755 [Bacillaceae bacterium W0354]